MQEYKVKSRPLSKTRTDRESTGHSGVVDKCGAGDMAEKFVEQKGLDERLQALLARKNVLEAQVCRILESGGSNHDLYVANCLVFQIADEITALGGIRHGC